MTPAPADDVWLARSRMLRAELEARLNELDGAEAGWRGQALGAAVRWTWSRAPAWRHRRDPGFVEVWGPLLSGDGDHQGEPPSGSGIERYAWDAAGRPVLAELAAESQLAEATAGAREYIVYDGDGGGRAAMFARGGAPLAVRQLTLDGPRFRSMAQLRRIDSELREFRIYLDQEWTYDDDAISGGAELIARWTAPGQWEQSFRHLQSAAGTGAPAPSSAPLDVEAAAADVVRGVESASAIACVAVEYGEVPVEPGEEIVLAASFGHQADLKRRRNMVPIVQHWWPEELAVRPDVVLSRVEPVTNDDGGGRATALEVARAINRALGRPCAYVISFEREAVERDLADALGAQRGRDWALEGWCAIRSS